MMAVNCYANPYPAFQPAMRIVTAITQANPAVVTTSFAHQYSSGIIVRLDVPLANGMQLISGIQYPITVLSPTTFSVPADSSGFQAFTNNVCCSVVPVGELNGQLTNATQNVLPYPAN